MLLAWVVLSLTNSVWAQNTDLELTSTLATNPPNVYSSYTIDLTLTNTSDTDATNIVVEAFLPAGTVFQGGDEFSTDTGIFRPSFASNTNSEWSINLLSAGASATLSLNYFLLTDDVIHHYAELVSVSENDTDSTPDNGTYPTPNEDDETVFTLPIGTPNCAITLEVTDVACSDAGTSDVREDDTFSYTILATGTDTGTGFTLSVDGATVGQYAYDTLITLDAGLIADVDSVELAIVDNGLRSCRAAATVTAPFSCSVDAPVDGIDLELELTATNSDVVTFQSSEFVLTLHNMGTDTAKGINVLFPMNLEEDIVFVDAILPVVSQGSYNPFDDDIWYVGTVAPGDSATIIANLYFLTKPFLYAEIIAMEGEDVDSEVNNGNGTTVTEDDEVAFGAEIGLDCSINITVTEKICYDAGTSDPSDDLFIFSFVAEGENAGDTYRILTPEGFPFEIAYGVEGQSLGVRPIADGPVTLRLQDRSNESCQATIVVAPPATCSAGVMELNGGGQGAAIRNTQLYPTQTRDRATVQFYALQSEVLSLEVFSVQGQLIEQRNWSVTAGINQYELGVSDWTAGSYWLRLSGAVHQETMRLVVVR